jgi:hypothetical protein
LTSSNATFAWTPGSGVSAIALYIGTAGVGSYNVYYGTQATDTRTVTGLPTSGAPIFVRLWSFLPSGWQYEDYTYNPSPGATAVAEMTSPAAGSSLASSIVTFRWTAGTNVSGTVLYVGTRGPGSYDLYYGSQGTSLSRTVASLPVNGSRIYVRLWSQLAHGWQYMDYAYHAATP